MTFDGEFGGSFTSDSEWKIYTAGEYESTDWFATQVVGPEKPQQFQFYSTSTSANAFIVNPDDACTFFGMIYVPNGTVTLGTSQNGVYAGAVVGDTVNLAPSIMGVEVWFDEDLVNYWTDNGSSGGGGGGENPFSISSYHIF